tara:strand:- start:3301 stop:3732 length:432 start_codon:yes stop_codon:yes gene_type:complete
MIPSYPLQRDEPIAIHTNEEKNAVVIRGRTTAAKLVNFLGALPDGGSALKWFAQCYDEGYRGGQAYIAIGAEGTVAYWDGCFGHKTLRRINKQISNWMWSEGRTTLFLELWHTAEDTDEWYNLALSRAHNKSQDEEETIEVEI